MDRILIILRYLLCLPGAIALLYAFSYPDSILPPNPAMESAEGINLYSFKPVFWLLPVLYMELVSYCGRKRNLVWFASLFTVLIAAVAVYPVLKAERPEVIAPTFSYQAGMLSTGLVYFSTFIAASLIIRKVFISYMFPPEDMQEQEEIGFVSASVLDPASARTVKEIAAEKKEEAPRFVFKPGDAHTVKRFKLLMQRLLLRNRAISISTGTGVLLLLLWFFLYPQPTAEEALLRDKQRMLQYRCIGNDRYLATTPAVHAAARVMKYISDTECLAGMQREEAEQWFSLGSLPAPYRNWIRDERPIKLASVNSMHENRTRFLTITNGRQICVLYIRANDEDGSIIISELQDAGWDAVADESRRRQGTDWGALFH